MSEYIFHYQVEGVKHNPWLPSTCITGKSMREAERMAQTFLSASWGYKLDKPVKITIKHKSAYRRNHLAELQASGE